MRWLLGLFLFVGVAARAEEAPLKLADLPSDAELVQRLWSRSPDAALARGRIEADRADEARSHLLPNPSLDLSWNTIPVGQTNPADLKSPLTQIPNYAAGISVPLEIGKRGPRQEAARHTRQSDVWQAAAQLRDRYFNLLDAIAEVAADEQRLALLHDLMADASRLAQLERLRGEKGDVSGLDADRAALEEQKLQASLGEQQEKLTADLRTCGDLAGVPCEPFGSATAAGAFLARRSEGSVPVQDRPDLKALSAQEEAAGANKRLADAHAIPDPTVRLGYVYDQFLISGNQGNSLFVGVTLPLPMFDHGQADADAARSAAVAASEAKQRLAQASALGLQRIEEQLAGTEARRAQLRDRSLPLARSLVDRLSGAVQRGAAPLQDLLLTRRSLGELLQAAGDLDLAAFHLSISRARLVGAMPLPPELNAGV